MTCRPLQTSFGADAVFDGPPPKKKKSKSTEQVLDVVSGGGLLSDSSLLAGMGGDLLSADLREQDWNFDPNEPRYCICNQVSYGDMVACDNEDVRYSFTYLILIIEKTSTQNPLWIKSTQYKKLAPNALQFKY